MYAAHAPRVLIFHSFANFWVFTCFMKGVWPFFVQVWAFLLILHDFGHFLHIFCVLMFLEVLRVLFSKVFPSLISWSRFLAHS